MCTATSPRRRAEITRAAFTPAAFTPAAFTLVELLVVIGIIALLISILLPALNKARQQAVMVKCLAQMKQLGNAFVMYANDNKGYMASCDTCGPLYPGPYVDVTGTSRFPNPTPTQTWVGWVDGGPSPASITNGTLYPYLKNPSVYHCPADTNQYRVRSYSMNIFIDTGDNTWWITNAFKIYKMTQVQDSSRAMLFVEEQDPRAAGTAASANAMINQWNLGGWNQNPVVADAWDGYANTWGDVVAAWHSGGANFTFVDGHAEFWKYSDPRTSKLNNGNPNWPSNSPQLNNVDLNRIRNQIVTWPQQRAAQ